MNEFRKEAKEARKRLRQGFWDDIIVERKNVIENAMKKGQDVKSIKDYYKKKIENKIKETYKTNALTEEDLMYKKVCSIMESQEVLLNPLSKLIDHNVYDKLSENAKQVYILKLSEQYVQMKQRYDSEHRKDFEIVNC